MKFREASSRKPKMVDASTKVDDSSTNSIENIDFEATTAAEGCALSFLETGVCSSGTNSLKQYVMIQDMSTGCARHQQSACLRSPLRSPCGPFWAPLEGVLREAEVLEERKKIRVIKVQTFGPLRSPFGPLSVPSWSFPQYSSEKKGPYPVGELYN